jgi:hypothetical protein
MLNSQILSPRAEACSTHMNLAGRWRITLRGREIEKRKKGGARK